LPGWLFCDLSAAKPAPGSIPADMLSLDDFSLLTSKIYASSLNSALWQDVVDFIHEKKGGMKVHLFGYDLEAGINLGQIGAGYSAEFEESYGRHYYRKNVFLKRYFEAPLGVPVSTSWMLPSGGLKQTEFYNDWLRPQEDIIGGGSLLLFKDESRMITFGSNLRARDVERHEQTWLDELKLLSPHLRQAFDIARALAGNAIDKTAASISPGASGAAVMVIGHDRRILYSNADAESMLCESSILTSRNGKRLCFVDTAMDDQFADTLSYFKMVRMAGPRTLRVQALGRDSGWVLRLAQIEPGRLDYSPAGLLVGPGDAALLLTLYQEQRAPPRGGLRERYGLTEQEAGIAIQLAEGLSVNEIADKRGRSVHTIRNQIKAVMGKLGVNRQASIIKLVSSLV
jgi:DNA-binding CsgD family transcriptional regulator